MADIQWFPGHMAKTGRELKESVKLADLVIELIDARIPKSSGNPDFDIIFAGRRRLIVLNKTDLADPARSGEWKDFYRKNGAEALFTNAKSGEGVSRIRKILRDIGAEKVRKQAGRGVIGRPMRAIVAGIPNSGKSALINILAGKAAAKTGDMPGITRRRQWIKLESNIELLDTPGVLWPKFENEEIALHLAFTGAIKDDVYDAAAAAEKLLFILSMEYRPLLINRYGDIFGAAEAKRDKDETDNYYPLLESVGSRRGFLMRGGAVDVVRAAAIVLDEFRAAKIGRITLEKPPKG